MVEQHPRPFAIREPKNRHNALAFAELPLIVGVMNVVSVVAPENEKPPSVSSSEGKHDKWARPQTRWMTDLKPSISVPDLVGVSSNAVTTSAKNFVIKVLAVVVVRQFSTKSAAIADALSCNPLYLAEQLHRIAGSIVKDQKLVVIHKWHIIVISMTTYALGAHSWWRRPVYVKRKP